MHRPCLADWSVSLGGWIFVTQYLDPKVEQINLVFVCLVACLFDCLTLFYHAINQEHMIKIFSNFTQAFTTSTTGTRLMLGTMTLSRLIGIYQLDNVRWSYTFTSFIKDTNLYSWSHQKPRRIHPLYKHIQTTPLCLCIGLHTQRCFFHIHLYLKYIFIYSHWKQDQKSPSV